MLTVDNFSIGCRAISILSIGSQTLHTDLEFRVRTLCELVLNEEHYLQPSVMSLLSPDGHEISKNAVIGTSASYDEALNRVHTEMEKDAAKTVLRLDCLDTAKNGTFSNILHVHAIASVLKRLVTSIYPEKNVCIRPLLHRVIPPRVVDHTLHLAGIPLLILWTSTNVPLHSPVWSPNHFVPCFSSTVDQCPNHSSTASSPQSPSTNVRYSSSCPKQFHTPIPVTTCQIVPEKSQISIVLSTLSTVASNNFIQGEDHLVSPVVGSLKSVPVNSMEQWYSNQLTSAAPSPYSQNLSLKCQTRLDQQSSKSPTNQQQLLKVMQSIQLSYSVL